MRQLDERGFGLIEMSVVVLIIAVLVGVGLPTLVGAQERGRDRAAQLDLRNAVQSARAVAVEDGYASIDADELEALEPSLTYDSLGDAALDVIGVDSIDAGSAFVAVTRSASGRWFGLAVGDDGRLSYCDGALRTACDQPDRDSGFTTSPW